MEHPARVAIIGCGLIGQKRAKVLGASQLKFCVDSVLARAEGLAKLYPGAVASDDWRAVVQRDDVDIVIVATPNNLLAPVSLAAVENGKHVLVEKPAGINPGEVAAVLAAARKAGVQVRVGFNHRYHPALMKAHEIWQSGAIGDLMFIRGRYGHGGRLGYEREWRADAAISGGGELIDQGVHLIDLARWFLGDFTKVYGRTANYFWKMPVEDNAFLTLETAAGQVAFLQVSCSEWKNLFSMEIYGRDGKLQIDGLGGSYGLERLTFYKMLPEMGPPETMIWEYPRGENSWGLEYAEFLEDIRLAREPAAGLEDALAALRVVGTVYEQNK